MNIYFFGDSINFGQEISLEENWVTRIGIALQKDFPDKDFLIQNPSINGNTTRMALERMPHDVQSHPVDILVITFGMNDCNYWQTDKGLPRVSPIAFEANMQEIIDRAKVFGVKQIIIHTNHPSSKLDDKSAEYEANNKRYNEIIRKIAAHNTDVIFVDIEKQVSKLSKGGVKAEDITNIDGIHLSKIGNIFFFDNIYPAVVKAVKEVIK